MRRNTTVTRFRRDVMPLAAIILVLAAAAWSCSQENRPARFEETLKKASDSNKPVVLDVSASW